MLRQHPLKKCVVIGLTAAAIVPGAAAARPADVPMPPASLAPAPAPPGVAAQSRTADELLPPARLGPATSASDDGGFDASVIAGLGGLALIAVLGAGSSFRLHVRDPRPATA
jgi:hypothetical protein